MDFAMYENTTTTGPRVRRITVLAVLSLASVCAACSSAGTGESSATTAPATTAAPTTASATTTTAAPTTTLTNPTTDAATTTTQAPVSVVAKGTWVDGAATVDAKRADGSVHLHGTSKYAGDLVGTEQWAGDSFPPDAKGLTTFRGTPVFIGTLAGVGKGSFGWREVFRDKPGEPLADVTVHVTGLTGAFVGMTGTVTYTRHSGSGTYTGRFTWKTPPPTT